jgi:hypothetical protein
VAHQSDGGEEVGAGAEVEGMGDVKSLDLDGDSVDVLEMLESQPESAEGGVGAVGIGWVVRHRDQEAVLAPVCAVGFGIDYCGFQP